MPAACLATAADATAAATLLHRFNTTYGEPAPPVPQLARRVVELIEGGDTAVLLAGDDGTQGIAVLRFRPALWADAPEAYLAELFVVPDARRGGLGGALMTLALEECRRRGCAWVDLGTDHDDADAHRLYERFGFTNLGSDGGPMTVYERDL